MPGANSTRKQSRKKELRFQFALIRALLLRLAKDCLFQRFQVLVWPDLPREWKLIDRAPNAEAADKARKVFDALTKMSADEPKRLKFSGEAQELFNDWRGELESKIRGGGLHPALV